MHTLFNPENKFWNFMGKITDVACMSILWLITSLPIITIGASTAAFYSFTLDAIQDNEGRVLSSYFSAFRENFKKSTLIWLIQLLAMVFMAVNLFAAWNFYLAKGALGLGVLSMALCGMLIVMGTGVFVYPIVVCYDFPVKKIIADSFVMAIRNPHVTVSVLVLFALTGMNDIRYLKELELLAKGTAKEKETAKFITKTMHEVAVVYPHDPARTEKARQEIIQRILDITNK